MTCFFVGVASADLVDVDSGGTKTDGFGFNRLKKNINNTFSRKKQKILSKPKTRQHDFASPNAISYISTCMQASRCISI